MKKIKVSNLNKYFLVDSHIYKKLKKYKWFFNIKNKKYKKGYIQRTQHIYISKNKYKRKTIYLHRYLTNASKGFEVDHINGNVFDNRLKNLRIVSHKDNMKNRKSVRGATSKHVGIHLHKLTGKWRAQINIDGYTFSLGLFKSSKEAAEYRLFFIEFFNLTYHGR